MYLYDMDEKLQILLGSCKNVNSVDVDNFQKIELENKSTAIIEYDVRNAISATEIFDAEREANDVYRIYGRIEYLSLLNGLKLNYTTLPDFFLPQTTNNKNIFNSFEFYLLKAGTGYTKTTGGTITTVGGNTIKYLIDEKFDNWVTASPTNYPFEWTASVGPGSYVQKTTGNQAQFVLGNQFINLVALVKDIPFTFGKLIIETNISGVSPSFDPAVDGISIIFSQNGNYVTAFPLLTNGIGYKKIEFTLPEISGITRVGIIAGSNSKSITMDYFKLYQTGSTDGSSISSSSEGYVRYFDVISKLSDFDIYNAGFTNNVYGDQVFSFNFNQDYDVSKYVDNFGFPATELFLYAQYKPTIIESMLRTSFGTSGIPVKVAFTPTTLNPGARIYGDLIDYNKPEFFQKQSLPQIYYINTPYNAGTLQWKYNPIIPFRLKYFYDNLNTANTGSTSYEQQSTIPYYATPLGNGNYIWRDIIPQGNVDPLTGLGVNYPFINKRRYLFSPIILDVSPNLSDIHTSSVFSEIKYGVPTIMNTNPNSDLDNIGKPCL